MSKRTPLKIARWALALSLLAYAYSFGLAYSARFLTSANPVVSLAWLPQAAAISFWSAIAICMSALACVVTQLIYTYQTKPLD